MPEEFDFTTQDLRDINGGSLAGDHEQQLIDKYKNDFSTDHQYGQLSVVEIMEETVHELVSRITELDGISEQRKAQIRRQILIFSLTCFDQGVEAHQ